MWYITLLKHYHGVSFNRKNVLTITILLFIFSDSTSNVYDITEEQVYDELRKLCSGEMPEEKYITKIMELGAGAGGVVTLAKVRIPTTLIISL